MAELAKGYVKANPYDEPLHVCREMAMELWRVFKDNNITSLIVVVNTEDQEEWLKVFASDHVWLVVLGRDDLNIGVETTNGVVYSPGYMKSDELNYELNYELACQQYGSSSLAYEEAKDRYHKALTEYEQHLEGYFHLSPANLFTSTILWFIP